MPSGVLNGGEFARESRSEADVALIEPPDPLAGTDTDLVTLADEDGGVALARAALLSARHYVNVKGLRYVSPDDLAQSTIEQVLAARARSRDQNRASAVVTEAYVQTTAWGFAVHAARGGLRQEDHKAIGIFTARVAGLEAQLGRPATGKERDEIAEDIWANWPDRRHRPHRDFVSLANDRVVSLDRPGGRGDGTLRDVVAERVTATDETPTGARYESTMDLAETGQKAAARRQLWDALAEMHGAPQVANHIGRSQALSLRMTISDAGGVADVVRNWIRTGEDTSGSDALFSPFGPLDVDGKDAVADMLSRHRDRAEELFSAALLAAAAHRG